MTSVPSRKPRHAWLLPLGTLVFCVGILLGRAAENALFPLLALGLAGLGLLLAPKKRAVGMALVLVFGAVWGFFGYHPPMPEEGAYLLRGTVAQEVALKNDGQAQTVLTDVTLDGQRRPNAYWTFYLDEGETLPEWLIPGAQVEAAVRVYHPSTRQNPGGFDFKEYLLQRGIRFGAYGNEGLQPVNAGFSLRGWLAGLRHDLTLRLMDTMGQDAGAYAAAMLLGTRDFIPEDDRAAFNDLGIAHILSVSGYHVGVLCALLLLLTRPLPLSRRWRLALEAAVLLGYCLLVGGNAPVVRAAGLLLLRELLRTRHRQLLPLHTLCATALTQLLFNPTLLTGASFQLTYGAMLGLLLVFPWLQGRRSFRTAPGQRLWEALCAATAAQAGVLAPQLYWFGELPLLSILLNMAVMTLSGGLMALYWAALATLWLPGLRELLGGFAAGATSLLLSAIRALAKLPCTTLWTRQADALTWLGWGLLILAASHLLPRRMEKRRPLLLTAGAALVAAILLPLPQNTSAYTQLSVGNADAAILQDRDMTVVIDVGEDGQALAGYLHQRRQRIEMLIVTHLHTDHAGGIAALLEEGVPVDVCCLPAGAELPLIDSEVLPLLENLAATGTEIRYLSRGDVLPLPSGEITVLWPVEGHASPLHDANDVGLALRAEVAGTTLLLTGDLTGAYERYAALPADILKAAHHGSASSTSEDFLTTVNPQVLLLSNRLESRAVRMAELAGEIPLYDTERDGAITVRFLGDGMFEVETTLGDPPWQR